MSQPSHGAPPDDRHKKVNPAGAKTEAETTEAEAEARCALHLSFFELLARHAKLSWPRIKQNACCIPLPAAQLWGSHKSTSMTSSH